MNHRHNIQATAREHLLALPGDEMIRHAAGSLTNAITVHCSRRELWPWLIQMGADRAGWYSYDALDNGVVTWSFMLNEIEPNLTRLIVRARGSDEYRFHGLPKAMGFTLARMVHFVMERKQLLEIARRAEGDVAEGARHGHQAES